MTQKKTDGDKGYAPFVNCELDTDDKEAIKSNIMKAVAAADVVAKLVENGYRVSFSWDERSDAVSVIITGVSETCPNKGWALSARAPSFLGAVTALWYKHMNKLGEDWPKGESANKREGWA